MLTPDARMAASELGLDDTYESWLACLDQAPEASEPHLPLHSNRDAAILARIGVSAQDADAVIASQPELDRSPGLRWLLRQCRRIVVAHIGDPGAPWLDVPQLPAALGVAGRCFPAHLFLATLPVTLDWHRRHDIPAEDSWAAFADLGRHMEIYRRTHGVAGVDEPWWLVLHLRGLLYEFGRLQFNLARLGAGMSPRIWYDDAEAGRLGVGFRPGDDALGVHIPEAGPLTPRSCADSVAAAAAFFGRYFPSASRRLATCESWLLDDQLAEYLPADSNIIRFQGMFTLVPGSIPGDKDVAQFVFRLSVPDLGAAPQRTALQRAVVSHLRTGRHWRVRCGWLELRAWWDPRCP